MFGSAPGPLRLLNSALGGQAGWLLGFALVALVAMLASSRLRRSDPRTGWLIAVGGAFATTALLFSVASGIFHPYYVSLLAPFAAALVGAGAGQLMRGAVAVRVFGPLAIAAGIATELLVLGNYAGQPGFLAPLLIACGLLASLVLWSPPGRILRRAGEARLRALAVALALAALLVAPSVWAVDTLGYAASGTFPSGGPTSAQSGPGGLGATAGPRARAFRGALPRAAMPTGQAPTPGIARPSGPAGGAPAPPPGAGGGAAGGAVAPGLGFPRVGMNGGGASLGGPFGGTASLKQALSYIKAHGGGTLAVSSQTSAAAAIISQNAAVAGIGGFSGRESQVSVGWLAQEVRAGRIRWVLGEQGSHAGPRLAGDSRAGSRAAIAAAAAECRTVTLPASAAKAAGGLAGRVASGTASGETTLYDCQGRAGALQSANS